MAGPNYGLLDNALVNRNRALEGYGSVNALIAQNLENQASRISMENAMAERAAAESAGGDATQLVSNMMRVAPRTGVALSKGLAESRKFESQAIGEDLKTAAAISASAQTPADMAMFIEGEFKGPLGAYYRSVGMTPEKSLAMLAEASKTPEGFEKFKQTKVMGMKGMYDQLNAEQNIKISQRNSDISAGNLAETRRGHDLQYDPRVVANTVTDNAGNVTQFNRYGQVIGTPGKVGKPSATFEKTQALKEQQKKDLTLAIGELEKATKDGGLIDQSTGSGIGRATDVTAGFFGKSTPGAIAIGKLKPIADLTLKMVPRFEGPQSDKDTQSYKEAAGQLADPNLPTDIRKAAGREVLRLMKERKGQFVSEAMASEGIGAGGTAAPPSGFQLDK